MYVKSIDIWKYAPNPIPLLHHSLLDIFMETVVLHIKDAKRKRFLLQLLAELDFIEIKPLASQLTAEEQRFIANLRSALRSVELHQQGKVQLKTAQQLLSEL
jgi:hypothetical protein